MLALCSTTSDRRLRHMLTMGCIAVEDGRAVGDAPPSCHVRCVPDDENGGTRIQCCQSGV